MECDYGHPNELPEDFGFKNLDISSFIDKLVDDTRNGTLVWNKFFDLLYKKNSECELLDLYCSVLLFVFFKKYAIKITSFYYNTI